MKVGQFSDSFLPIVDGVGRVVYNYAVSLSACGAECYVVSPMADAGFRGGLPFDWIDFNSYELPLQQQYNAGIPMLDAHFEARMKSVQLDVVHAHSPFIAGMSALRYARRHDVPLIGTFHSRYYDDFYKLTRMEMLASLGVRAIVDFYERCDEVWTVSQSSAETLRDYGYSGDLVVMPNGTPDVEPNEKFRLAAREKFALPDVPILFYCGQINWKKNILRILESAALLKKKGAAFALVLAGQGPDSHAIAEKAVELNLDDRMIYTGHVTSEALLYGLYENAALFVFPSLYDTSGMVVREAAAMGTPSVVVAGSAAAEPIQNGVNGFTCADTTASLLSVLETALSDPQNTRSIGANARKTIYLSWDDIAKNALRRYETLVRNQ